MDKFNYIVRQLSRAEKKRFEHYVVTRIWHLLNDLTIKFVTQQYVIRPEGRALTDMFFPQFGVHIEVDEVYHLNRQEQDLLRESDIVNATNHKIIRVDTSKGIENVNLDIEEIVKEIHLRKISDPTFTEWDLQKEQDPQTYIKKGFIDVSDDVAFKQSYLAANCFGFKYKGYQRGGVKHPIEVEKLIWFPKLYKNKEWNNSISDDDLTITEINENPNLVKSKVDEVLHHGCKKRIVFARVKSPLGDVMYRFKGEYKLDEESTNYNVGLIWKRISDTVKTYSIE